eukprot:478602_1
MSSVIVATICLSKNRAYMMRNGFILSIRKLNLLKQSNCNELVDYLFKILNSRDLLFTSFEKLSQILCTMKNSLLKDGFKVWDQWMNSVPKLFQMYYYNQKNRPSEPIIFYAFWQINNFC